MCCTARCVVRVLYSRVCCTAGCVVQQGVLYSKLCCTARCVYEAVTQQSVKFLALYYISTCNINGTITAFCCSMYIHSDNDVELCVCFLLYALWQWCIAVCLCVHLSRLWFPCVDSQSELCPWDIAVTVPVNLVAVASGELTDQVGQGRGGEGRCTGGAGGGRREVGERCVCGCAVVNPCPTSISALSVFGINLLPGGILGSP